MKHMSASLFAIAALSGAGWIAGCGDDEDNGSGQQQAQEDCATPDELLNTSWARCENKTEGVSFRTVIDFSCDQATAAGEFFTAAGCEGEGVAQVTQSYRAAFGDEIPGTDGVRELNLVPVSAEARVTRPEGAVLLNALEFCGVTDWKVGKDVDLFEAPGASPDSETCPVPAEGRELFFSWRLDQDRLFLPDEDPSETESDRPTEVSSDPFERQVP